MLGRIFWLPTWEKKFSLSFIVYQSVNVVVVLSGKACYCETWITYTLLILRLYVTQHNKLHGTTRQTKYKVSVLYLSQYFNHSAKYVKKEKHKSFRKLALLLLHKGFNFCIQDILQQCKRIIQHQNEDTAEDKHNC